MIVGLMTNSFFDSKDYENPIKTIGDYIFNEQLDEDKNTRREVTLNYNIAVFNDRLFQVSDELEIENRSWLSKEAVTEMYIRYLNPTAYF